MAHDLLAAAIDDRDLAVEDRDEGIRRVADLEERVADVRGALFAGLAQQLELGA